MRPTITATTTAAPATADGGPGAAVELVARSVADDPNRPRTWHISSSSRTHVSIWVGDACGCGTGGHAVAQRLRATTAALLQDGHDATEIAYQLERATPSDDTFTALVGCDLDPITRSVTILQAGLPPPLALPGKTPARFLDGGRHPPLGLPDHTGPEPVAWVLPTNTTLLMFTFGLVERRPDSLDTGLDHLLHSADANRHHTLPALVDRVAGELSPPPGTDYTLIGLRTTEPTSSHR